MNKHDLMEDLENMETALCRLEDSPDIWQNNIIKALCRSVYHLLLAEIRRTK